MIQFVNNFKNSRLATEMKKPRRNGAFITIRRYSRLSSNPEELDGSHVNCSRAFLAVLDFEFNVLAFSQSFEAVTLDCREVYEYIFAAVSWSNETKTFRLVEPLNLTFNLCHFANSLDCILRPQA